MRIGLLVGRNQIGGTERQMAMLARGLKGALQEVHLFFLAPPPRMEPLDIGGLRPRYLFLNRYTRPASLRAFNMAVLHRKLDLVHAFLLGSMEFALEAAELGPFPPVIGSIRDTLFARDERERHRLSTVARRLYALTCNCEAIGRDLVGQGVSTADRVVTIPNGIERPRKAAEPTGRGPLVLFAGTLYDVKDPVTFVQAAAAVLADYPTGRVVIAGDGPLRQAVEAAIDASGRADAFTLLGRVPAEAIPYHEADLVVSSSLREGSSNTVLEALAHGVPVVGTAVGGTVEVLRERAFGRLVPARDPKAMAEAMQELLALPHATRTELGREARQVIGRDFAPDAMVNRHLELYHSLLHRRFDSWAGPDRTGGA